jgi:uncharacterized protein
MEILSPGIYSQILSSGDRPVQGVSTSTMATIGFTLKGTTTQPILVTSLLDAVRKLGDFTTKSDVMFGLKLFFENGGSRAYVSRIVPTNSVKSSYAYQEAAVTKWTYTCLNQGEWSNNYMIWHKPNVDNANYRDVVIADSVTATTIDSGTLVSGSTSTSINLALTASDTNDAYDSYFVEVTISGNTERRKIKTYTVTSSPASKVAVVDVAFSQAPTGSYTVKQIIPGNILETYEGVTYVDADMTLPNYITSVIQSSEIVTAAKTTGTAPIVWSYGTLSGGSDGTFNSVYFPESLVINNLTVGLSPFDNLEGMLLNFALPDFEDNVTQAQLSAYVGARNNCYGIISHPSVVAAGSDPSSSVVDYVKTTLAINPSYGKVAFYTPWLTIYDTLRQITRLISPSTAMAGIFARNDSENSIGKAPSGDIRSIDSLQYTYSRGEMDILYPYKINPLEASTISGLNVNGVRTLSTDPEWRYINAIRTIMYVDNSLTISTQWAKFENNGPKLWTKIKMQVDGFLRSSYEQGLFAGSTPSESYFVVVDSSNNPQASVDNGFCYVDIGVAINKPAEFIVFRLKQMVKSS